MLEQSSSREVGALPVESPVTALPRLWWLHVVLFLATFLTTTAFGSALVESFDHNRPLSVVSVIDAYTRLVHLDRGMWSGLSFSLPLLTILLSHELGHYIECQRRGVDATLPYFLPSPSLFGTLGAFIRIRSPIYTRAGLFDIGVLGPLAGFVMLVPFLTAGVFASKVVINPVFPDAIVFGTPLAVRLLECLFFPGSPSTSIALHPMAMAAWAGLFATALNLLPIGQLDGGHILYALGRSRWHKRISLAFIFLLGLAGFFYWPWWIWGALMFFFKRHHPLVHDEAPLPRSRIILCAAAIAMFILSVALVPVRTT